MPRQARITKHIGINDIGIEIGPWCNPLTPKGDGYKCLVLDVFDTEELKRRASGDITLTTEMAKRIENVDLVGSSAEIAELAEQVGVLGQVDYIVSSHNFEHIPDPIRFLQGCEKVLRHGGRLSMAIPDRRGCFDFYRPNSTLSQMLDAYFDERVRPSEAQIFEHASHHSRKIINGDPILGFSCRTQPSEIVPYETLREAFQAWSDRINTGDEEYHDAHCWTFTPTSFELILKDIVFLGLSTMQLTEIDAVDGEFYVHLTNNIEPEKVSNEDFYKNRAELLLKINDEISVTAPAVHLLINESKKIKFLLDAAKEKIEDDDLLEKIVNLSEQLMHSQERVTQLESIISGMKKSKSWRLTKPLRALMIGFRKI